MKQCKHEWIRRPSRWECDICFEDVWDYSLGDDSTPPNERPVSKDKQIFSLKEQVEALADIADELDKNTSNYFSYESRDAIIEEALRRVNQGSNGMK